MRNWFIINYYEFHHIHFLQISKIFSIYDENPLLDETLTFKLRAKFYFKPTPFSIDYNHLKQKLSSLCTTKLYFKPPQIRYFMRKTIFIIYFAFSIINCIFISHTVLFLFIKKHNFYTCWRTLKNIFISSKYIFYFCNFKAGNIFPLLWILFFMLKFFYHPHFLFLPLALIYYCS